MSVQHRELAAGRWAQMSFLDQMGNIGSEVERAINWRAKGDLEHSRKAGERALELLDLTIGDGKNRSRLGEIVRVREVMVDSFFGENEYSSRDEAWKSYFNAFALAARKNR